MRLHSLATLLLGVSLAACGGDRGSDDDGKADNSAASELNLSGTKVFDCKTEREVDGREHRIQFSVKNITSRRNIEVLTPEGREDEDYAPIKTTPAEGRVAALNENMSAATGSRLLRISGDSDGFFLIDLVLYKNSDYSKGYLRISGGEDDGPNQYSKVSCTVR